ncbi:ferredoxin [Xylophilus rhododendri]|uniref:Ferredoxin n=1 Tax=Xylophilus rhododendri TaxID=2697032 RepID=A0A857J3T7_9BURK|nr:ferredoxin [Xylophilus rhododendri]QHI98594.1 ferredoxin [Xylophilus rhododendri]
MYLVLTSKPGQFRTEMGEGLAAVQSYDYVFCGRVKARFVIAELTGALATTRVKVIDESGEPSVNSVPAKFLERFDTVEAALRELHHLTSFGSIDTALIRV